MADSLRVEDVSAWWTLPRLLQLLLWHQELVSTPWRAASSAGGLHEALFRLRDLTNLRLTIAVFQAKNKSNILNIKRISCRYNDTERIRPHHVARRLNALRDVQASNEGTSLPAVGHRQ